MQGGNAIRCRDCGKDNVEGERFCAGCGAQLSQEAVAPPPPKSNALGEWSLVLGILSLCTLVTSIPGLILGIVGIKQINVKPEEYTGKGAAIAGTVVSAIGLVCLSIVAILRIFFPLFGTHTLENMRYRCMDNARQIAWSFRFYQEDNNGCYPSAAHWNDALAEYACDGYFGPSISTSYKCPSVPGLRCGYAMNSNLSGQPMSAIKHPGLTVAIFECDKGWNASGGPEAMIARPRHKWFTIACADGDGIKVFPEDSRGGVVSGTSLNLGYKTTVRWDR